MADSGDNGKLVQSEKRSYCNLLSPSNSKKEWYASSHLIPSHDLLYLLWLVPTSSFIGDLDVPMPERPRRNVVKEAAIESCLEEQHLDSSRCMILSRRSWQPQESRLRVLACLIGLRQKA